MITLEQVEKLRERANVSYDDAKTALEEANGDVLEALIQLEKKGSVTPPLGGGYYSSEKGHTQNEEAPFLKKEKKYSHCRREGEAGPFRRFGKFCAEIIRRGNLNSIDITKDGDVKTTISITILVVLMLLFFWVTVPLLVIGLFCGYRYVFNGPDFGKDTVNNAMNMAADTAEKVKRSVMEGQTDQKE
ncbi:MAG: ubiquitin [Clostridia bacterium]|nr:ubiquitin [Clostridia bacterium]